MIAPQSIAEILGLGQSVRTVRDLETAVSAGLPKRALEQLSARLYNDRGMASAYKFKVVPRLITGTGLSSLLSGFAAQQITQIREPARTEKFGAATGPRITTLTVKHSSS